MADRSDLYPGAVVTVRAKVTHVGDNGVTVEALAPNEADVNHMRDIGVHFRDILSVEPRPLAVGDRVRCTAGMNGGLLGDIVHIHNGIAWVDFGDCETLEKLSSLTLTRIPEPAPAEEAMRFKVGDMVADRDIGHGTVIEVRQTSRRCYRVKFPNGGFVLWCRDADLSPAPAEERET